MSEPRILVAMTSHCPDEYTRDLCKLNHRVIRTLNPDDDFSLIDCGSPFDPNQFLPDGTNIFRFEDNIGAINRGGRDGAGRGVCKAVEMAIDGGYDYVAITESDFFFCQPARPIINKMHKAGVKVASPGFATPFWFPEWGIFFINVHYAKEFDFIGKYDWPNTSTYPLLEIKLERLFGDDLFMLGIRGQRNDYNQVNVANLANNYPYGNCQWLTQNRDPNVYLRLLELNGIVPK
jgi:hypothetical protein